MSRTFARLEAGLLTEEGFLRLSRWYDNWGSDFGYYRDILTFARENRSRISQSRGCALA